VSFEAPPTRWTRAVHEVKPTIIDSGKDIASNRIANLWEDGTESPRQDDSRNSGERFIGETLPGKIRGGGRIFRNGLKRTRQEAGV
jgi:hypothetical protein